MAHGTAVNSQRHRGILSIFKGNISNTMYLLDTTLTTSLRYFIVLTWENFIFLSVITLKTSSSVFAFSAMLYLCQEKSSVAAVIKTKYCTKINVKEELKVANLILGLRSCVLPGGHTNPLRKSSSLFMGEKRNYYIA